MVALILTIALAAELALYALLGRNVAALAAWPGIGLAVWVAGCFVLLRLFFAMMTRTVAWLYRDRKRRGPPVSFLRWAAGVLWDVACYAIVFACAQPLERLLRRPPRPLQPRQALGQGEPVLLVHGLWCNGGMWWSMRARLERAGHRCATVNLAPPLAGIDEFVPQLAAAIESLCAASGAPRVRLVCHSMGGLVARAYLARCGGNRIASVITLGSPHHGSALAGFSFGRCVREMQPQSAWLAVLNRDDGAALPLPFVSVFSWQDNLVAPATSSLLPGARNLAIGGVGHVSMPWTPRVQAIVLALLDDPRAKLDALGAIDVP